MSGSNPDVDHSILDAGRLLISDVDGTLLEGGRARNGCAALAAKLLDSGIGLVLATGRDLLLTRLAIDELASTGFPRPQALVCSVGTEIYLGHETDPDLTWSQHIAQGWDGEAIRAALAGVDGLVPQQPDAQGEFKASYLFTTGASDKPPSGSTPEADVGRAGVGRVDEARVRETLAEVGTILARAGLRARLVGSAGRFLDVLPERASKGAAVRWLIARSRVGHGDVVVAGDSGNDREMLNTTIGGRPLRAVVVGNRDRELDDLAAEPHVYMARHAACSGVLEGLLAHGW